MEIIFRTRKLAKIFNSTSALQKAYGDRTAQTIMRRLAVLKNASTLSLVPTTKPERCHQLTGDRRGQYAIDLIHPHRLIFKATHEPLPRKENGAIDTDQVTAITVIAVVDYH